MQRNVLARQKSLVSLAWTAIRRVLPASSPGLPTTIDPIEELARIINGAQDRDAKDERRFDDLARSEPQQRPKRVQRKTNRKTDARG